MDVFHPVSLELLLPYSLNPMYNQKDHLFIDEPTTSSINNNQTIKHYPFKLYSNLVNSSISWFQSSVNLSHSIDNHRHHRQTVSRIKKRIAQFYYKQTAVPTQPSSFLFFTYPLSKFTILLCLFIFLYLFSSTFIFPSTSIPAKHPTLPSLPAPSDNQVNQVNMASENPFDVDKVCEYLKQYNEDVSALSLDLYIEAYKELQKFFDCLGSVFSFVTSDVENKINILECYRKDQNCGSEYKTLQSMIEYEAKNNLLKSEERPSGARTLLRLHRALEFISKFILEVSKLEDSAATGPAARSAYQTTLAKFHPWVIRKTASLAMYGLPNREQLVIRAFNGQSGDAQAKSTQVMITLAELSETAYNVTNKLYEDNNLLDLP